MTDQANNEEKVSYRRPACGFMPPDYLVIQADLSGIIMPDGLREQLNVPWVDVDLPGPYFGDSCRATKLSWHDAVLEDMWFFVYLYRSKNVPGVKLFVTHDRDFLPTREHYALLNDRFGAGNWVYIGTLRKPSQTIQSESIVAFNQSQHAD